MGVTKNGICYDLKTSPYNAYVCGYTFFFSSPAHMRKFMAGYERKQEWLADSLMRRFVFEIDVELLAVFHFYRQIETRGFLVLSESGVFECPENITFRGMKPSVND